MVKELRAVKNNFSDERDTIIKKHFAHYDAWLDRCETGPRWLEDENIAGIVAEKLHSLDKERYKLVSYCLMPNHVHLLIEPITHEIASHHGTSAKYPLTEILRLIKGSTAYDCNLALGRTGRFWQQESYDRYVRDEQEFTRIIQYILNNPVKAGLAKGWKDWRYSYVSPEFGEW
ncbi:MAG: hypothetical protein OHK0031_03950 [Anaerolineales bacterium]